MWKMKIKVKEKCKDNSDHNKGGSSFCWEGLCGDLYGDSRNLLRTRCIGFQVLGNLSLYTHASTFILISNGPYHLLLSSFIGWSILILVTSSHTLPPLEYCLASPFLLSE